MSLRRVRSRNQSVRGKRAGGGLMRTQSVRVRDFTCPDRRAYGRMADRQDREAGNWLHVRIYRRYMALSGQAVCKTVGLAYAGFEPNTCHHLRKRPVAWAYPGSRAALLLSRRVS